jgi:hypothetical protein
MIRFEGLAGDPAGVQAVMRVAVRDSTVTGENEVFNTGDNGLMVCVY